MATKIYKNYSNLQENFTWLVSCIPQWSLLCCSAHCPQEFSKKCNFRKINFACSVHLSWSFSTRFLSLRCKEQGHMATKLYKNYSNLQENFTQLVSCIPQWSLLCCSAHCPQEFSKKCNFRKINFACSVHLSWSFSTRFLSLSCKGQGYIWQQNI